MEPTNEPNAPQQNAVIEEKSAVGPTIALIVIILILLVGGLYFWSQNQDAQPENTPQSNDPDVASIEADINGSSLDDTEDDLSDVDAAFESQAETN